MFSNKLSVLLLAEKAIVQSDGRVEFGVISHARSFLMMDPSGSLQFSTVMWS